MIGYAQMKGKFSELFIGGGNESVLIGLVFQGGINAVSRCRLERAMQ